MLEQVGTSRQMVLLQRLAHQRQDALVGFLQQKAHLEGSLLSRVLEPQPRFERCP